ncbi:MAG: AAA family ATPase [Deltaproteobacteria bacterium]|nr:MAG: AAA family ATPase [Deltaproteobacteria bacterium]
MAVSGKGGTGKTTFSSLIVRSLIHSGKKPILAIDADADGNLAEALGLNGIKTVGEVLEEMEQKISQFPPGFSKDDWLEAKLAEVMVEERGFDFLSMGRGEGPGCYCYVNSVLRRIMDNLENSYTYLVMDNAAGMEHLSRRTTREADILFLISDHSLKGVQSGARIAGLAKELELDVKTMGFVINRVPGEIDPLIVQKVEATGLAILGSIPEDDQIGRFDIEGRSLLELPEDNKVVRAVTQIVEKIL